MSRLLSERTVYWWSVLLSIDVLPVLLLAQSAMAADVTALFQEARTTANQLNRDAALMESFTRSNLSWQSHSAQITRIKDHINQAGQILAQMHAAREDAKPWHQDAIDGITSALKQLAANTESIINHLNENPNRLRNPTYIEYLRSNAQSASQLSAAVGNVVDYDDTKTRMEELEAKLGSS
jgi:hypothetical protein